MILLIFFENSVFIINEKYAFLCRFAFLDHVILIMFRFLWNISFCFSNFLIASFCFFAFTFWIQISCIKILYDFFKIFVEFSIDLIHFVFFSSFFLTIADAKNSIRFSLKSYLSLTVSLLLFFVVFLILFSSSKSVICRSLFFSISFSIRTVSSFFFFVVIMLAIAAFFTVFSFSFSILVIFVVVFITLAYVFALVDWLTFCFSIVWSLLSIRFNVRASFGEFSTPSFRFASSYRDRFSAFCWLLSCRRWARPSALDLFVSLLFKHVFEIHLDDIASSS